MYPIAPRTRLNASFRAGALSVFLLTGLTLAGGAYADTAPSAQLKALAAKVTEMGSTPKFSPSGGHFYIDGNDKHEDTIDFALSTDNSYVWVYSQLTVYTDAQMQQLSAIKLLQANDSNPEYFSINSDGGKNYLYLQTGFPVEAVSAHTLRDAIDRITSMSDDNAPVWDPKGWK